MKYIKIIIINRCKATIFKNNTLKVTILKYLKIACKVTT